MFGLAGWGAGMKEDRLSLCSLVMYSLPVTCFSVARESNAHLFTFCDEENTPLQPTESAQPTGSPADRGVAPQSPPLPLSGLSTANMQALVHVVDEILKVVMSVVVQQQFMHPMPVSLLLPSAFPPCRRNHWPCGPAAQFWWGQAMRMCKDKYSKSDMGQFAPCHSPDSKWILNENLSSLDTNPDEPFLPTPQTLHFPRCKPLYLGCLHPPGHTACTVPSQCYHVLA